MTSCHKKRIVICSKDSLFTDDLLAMLSERDGLEIVGLVSSSRMVFKNETPLRSILFLLRHCGLAFAIYLLRVTEPGLLFGDGYRWKKLKVWSKTLKSEYWSTSNINEADMISALQALDADYLVSVNFNQIFSAQFIAQIGCPILNIHPGPLPEQRGMDPTFFAMLRGDVALGATVHFIDEQIDTGQVLAKETFEQTSSSLLFNTRHAFSLGGKLLLTILAGKTTPVSIPDQSRYDSWPTKADVRTFRRNKTLV